MKKINLLLATSFLCLLLSNCSKTNENISNETHRSIQVNLVVNEQYQYDTKIIGDEEGASISIQASHFEVSEIIRNDLTNFSAVYTYKPELNFIGMDEVELKLATGSNGEGPSTHFEFIKITFNILNKNI